MQRILWYNGKVEKRGTGKSACPFCVPGVLRRGDAADRRRGRPGPEKEGNVFLGRKKKQKTLEEMLLELLEEGDNKRRLCEAVLAEALEEKRSGAARAVFQLAVELDGAADGSGAKPLTVRFDLGDEYEK